MLLKDLLERKRLNSTNTWLHDLNGVEIIGTFYKKELQKTNQHKFRIEKVRKKVISYMSNGEVMIVQLIAGLIKKT